MKPRSLIYASLRIVNYCSVSAVSYVSMREFIIMANLIMSTLDYNKKSYKFNKNYLRERMIKISILMIFQKENTLSKK